MWPSNTSPDSSGPPVTSPFRVELADAGSALAVHVAEANELRAALEALGLHPPRPTVVVVGGAAGLEEAQMDGLRAGIRGGHHAGDGGYRAVGVDGGTRFGVMRLFGEARAATRLAFPLVGVVAAGTVKLPRGRTSRPCRDSARSQSHTLCRRAR